MAFVPKLRAAQSGDQNAIRAIIDEFSKDVRAVGFGFDVEDDVEISRADLIQDAWVKIWVQIARFEIQGNDETAKKMFRAWIRRIARNEMINILGMNRAAKRRPPTRLRSIDEGGEPAQNRNSPSKMFSSIDELDRLNWAIQQLHEREKFLIRRSFFDKQSVKQIAADEGLTYGKVRYQIGMAITQLQHHMKQAESQERTRTME